MTHLFPSAVDRYPFSGSNDRVVGSANATLRMPPGGVLNDVESEWLAHFRRRLRNR